MKTEGRPQVFTVRVLTMRLQFEQSIVLAADGDVLWGVCSVFSKCDYFFAESALFAHCLMLSVIREWFSQPHLSPYERDQQQRTLAIILRVILISGISLFFVNVYINAWGIAVALLMMTGLCIPAIRLNSRGHFMKAACLTLTSLFLVAQYNLYASGGLQDSGMLAYPMIIIVGSLLLGKRAIPVLSLISLGSLAVLASLELNGYFAPAPSVTDAGFCLSVAVLLMASSALVWVIIGTTERNIAHIKQAETELLSSYDLTLAVLAKALEFRDRDTEGHSRRVVDLSVRLAQEMSCSEADIAQIRRGALIHDIGKVAIPDYILSKPGPLDPEEKKIMEKHTVYAREMLAPISFLRQASEISFCHHERWDGRGYPRGLRGSEIPKPARIFAIVDQWDALSSERPYRKAWPREQIISYVRENSGTQFDPEVVEAFCRIIEKSPL